MNEGRTKQKVNTRGCCKHFTAVSRDQVIGLYETSHEHCYYHSAVVHVGNSLW